MPDSREDMRFGFGSNWNAFVRRCFTEKRVSNSLDHMLGFLGVYTLAGKTFLDIGCGSGLHSLAAYKAGAKRIVSFDFDQNSVDTTELLRRGVGNPPHWTVMQGSVLDAAFMGKLEKADVVYSWGVLHHTGSMWEAVRNAAGCMEEDGVFYVAIYDPTDMQPSAGYWVEKKQEFNKAGKWKKRFMEWWYVWRFIMQRDPRKFIYYRNLKNNYALGAGRGMSLHTDIVDWIGGWPFEYATPAEFDAFCSEKLGLGQLKRTTGHACAEYLYAKNGMEYQPVINDYFKIPLTPPFQRLEGNCWYANLPEEKNCCDTNEEPRRSPYFLLENDKRIGTPHVTHENIIKKGLGWHSHWDTYFYFSTSDNTDPNTTGRSYAIARSGDGE